MTDQKKNNDKKIKKRKKIKYTLLSILLFLLVISGVSGYYFFEFVVSGLPSLEELENPTSHLASNIYSNDGELLDQYYLENRIETELDSIPEYVINALIDTEDLKFYEHWGVDLDRLSKAIIKTIFMGRREGGSTITQQLAKNLYGLQTGPESFFDTVVRKFREWITAVEIEKSYTKKEILEMYFNTHYLGKRAFGIGMASKVYFNRKPSKLTLPQGALIVGLFNKPGRYNPDKNYDLAIRKRNQIMYNMVKAEDLSIEEYNKLKVQPIVLPEERIVEGTYNKSICPHYIEQIRQDLTDLGEEKGFDIYRDGLSIYTTLDSRMQRIALNAVEGHLVDFQEKFDKHWDWNDNKELLESILVTEIRRQKEYKNASTAEEKTAVFNSLKTDEEFVDSIKTKHTRIEVALVSVDAKNGEIRAMVGGRNQNNGRGWNHVTQMKRQPGSAFKPILYTAALDNGLYPAFPILNQPVIIDGWQPKNFSNRYGGFMTLREALRFSTNTISVRLLAEGYVELYQLAKYARDMGIKTRFTPYYSSALGTPIVSPVELVSVYGTLANKGIYNEPHSVTSIEDKDGILVERFAPETREAISEETAFLMTSLLRTVLDSGSGSGARYKYGFWVKNAAGKTGTTQDYRNAWFAGYTPQLATVVWVGFNNEQISFDCLPNHDGQGARAAMPIWAAFMRDVYEELEIPEEEFEMPESGEIAYVYFCRDAIEEYGVARLYSQDCEGEKFGDYVRISADLPFFNEKRDTFLNFTDRFVQFAALDSTSHEAQEIIEVDSTLIFN